MTEAQMHRNAKHKAKRESEGFVQVRIWIPKGKREDLKTLAEKWRNEKN